MAKKNTFIWITIIAFALVLLLGTGFFLYFHPFSQTTVQGGFDCPTNKYCTATPILKCTTQTSQAVNFRTNSLSLADYAKSGAWIAISCVPMSSEGKHECIPTSDLKGYCLASSSSQDAIGDFLKSTLFGSDIRIYNSRIYVRGGTSNRYYKYEPCIFAELSISPTEPYKTNQQEMYSGNLYSCSRTVSITGEVKETMSWASNTPTPTSGQRGNTYSLTGGQSITSSGTGGFEVEYSINDIPITTCTTSNGTILQMGSAGVCTNPYLLEKCENIGGKPTLSRQNAVPPQVCRDGAITDAYHVEITIPKLVISKSEKLNIQFYLKDTPTNKNIDVTASITKANFNPVSQTHTTGSTYTTAGKTSFIFDAPPIGYYTLTIAFSHPDGDFSQSYNLQVTDDLTLTLTTANPVQYDSSAPEITLNSFKSGSAKDLTAWDLEAKYNGNLISEYTTEHPNVGSRKFIFTSLVGKGDGTLRVRARGNDETGLWTEWTEYFDITVKKASILVSANFETDKCAGVITQRFETKDSLGNYVGTTNTVTIEKPLGGTDTASVTGANGQYQFSYNFAEGGIYTIRITSNNPTLGTSQLNSGQGQIVNILTGASCNDNRCEGFWECYQNYIIFGGIGLAIIVSVYLIFFFRRKK